MKKCAWIRSDKSGKLCPFGLPIINSCQNIGNAILHCCPLEAVEEEKREQVATANKRVYIYYKDGSRCLYAASIMENNNSVNCDQGDTAAGMHSPVFNGSPMYSQTWSSCGLDGLKSFPLGFYSDNQSSRNLFQGLFSLVGNKIIDIIKYSIENNNVANIINKIGMGEELINEEIEEIKRLKGD